MDRSDRPRRPLGLKQARAVFDESIWIAKRIASKFSYKFRATESAEFENAALTGLWQAALKHHALPAREFEAVAFTRVRGACVDLLRSNDRLNRRQRKLGLPAPVVMVSLDDLHEQDVKEYAIGRRLDRVLVEFATTTDPASDIDDARRRAAFIEAIAGLKKRDRYIVDAVLAGRPKRAIAKDLGVTQPRITQVMSRITAELREKLMPGSALSAQALRSADERNANADAHRPGE